MAAEVTREEEQKVLSKSDFVAFVTVAENGHSSRILQGLVLAACKHRLPTRHSQTAPRKEDITFHPPKDIV